MRAPSIKRLDDELPAGTRLGPYELVGPLGPGGAQIYRVRFPRKPKSMYIELREDQLISIPEET